MSFTFNPLNNNGIPSMVSLLGNIHNGPGFVPPLSGPSLEHLQNSTALQQLVNQQPGLNDSPLEFNVKKSMIGAGPMDLENSNELDTIVSNVRRLNRPVMVDTVDRDCSLIRRSDETCNKSMNGNENNRANNLLNNAQFNANEVLFNGVNGMMLPQNLMMVPGMMNLMDTSILASIPSFPMLNQLNTAVPAQSPTETTVGSSNKSTTGSTTSTINVKEIILCKLCTLYPPNPGAPQPSTRERPQGCRTVFVGGLPENITDDIIREIFERCGEITTLRLSKKNFCHIRFVFEASVDSAIYLSGYRIRIGNNNDTPNSGRLHVDYAQARDDQYEWECKQRQYQREQRHRERVERDRLRPLSPPPIVHYTEHEAAAVAEKLKQDETFSKAVQVLVTWLERGDCIKKNSNTFYSMIQSTNSHVRRLQNEKTAYEDDLYRAKEQYKKQIHSMSVQFTQIEKVFGAASHKKVWDHFTKAQRKNIDLWKKQSMEIRIVQLDENAYNDNDEMEMSDEDFDHSGKRIRLSSLNDNDSLKCDLTTYKTDTDFVKSLIDLDTDVKDQQMKVLQETIRNLQTQLIENKSKERENVQKINDLEIKLKQANVKELLLKTKIVDSCKTPKVSDHDENEIIDLDDDKDCIESKPINSCRSSVSSHSIHASADISCEEARIIGLVSTFLVVHPFGASLDYVFSYVQRIAPRLRPKELEEILSRYSSVFCEEVTGIGAKIERKWKFCGFDLEINNAKFSD